MRQLLFLLLFSACGAEKELNDSGDVGGPSGGDGGGGEGEGEGESESVCEEDADCPDWQICESDECLDGDRNNAKEEGFAVTLSPESTVSSYINKAGDADYYTFATAGGEFMFAFTDAHEDDASSGPFADTFLTLYDPEGDVVTTADNFPNGSSVGNMDSALWAYLSQAGTYTLKVEDANPINGNEAWGGREYTYSLTLKAWSQATYGESSFDAPYSPGEAGLELVANTLYAVGIVLENEGDIDYIDVSFPYNDAAVYVDGIEDLSGSDANPRASILTTEEALLATRDEVGPAGPVIYPNMSSGSFVVAVEDADGGGGANYWTVLIIKAGDEGVARSMDMEPNDTTSSATELEMAEKLNASDRTYFEGKVQGEMNSPGDVDLWQMTVDGSATVETEDGDEVQYLVVCVNAAKWGSSIAPDLAVYDASGVELASSAGSATASPNNNIENVPLTPGETVYVSVTAGEESAGTADEWYFLNTYIASFSVSSYEEGGYSCP
jgi:hypothetical protein